MARVRAGDLARVAQDIQTRVVLPHCPVCRAPCCLLATLVLELTWARLKGIWGLAETRIAFDRRLSRGEGPAEIRPRDGLYYAHGSPCPAYEGRRCRVYRSRLKPPGCSDFPVYEEEGRLVADLRCEALDADAVEAELRQAVGAGCRVTRTAERDFPFLVRFRAGRRSRRRVRLSGAGKERGGEP